MRFFVGGDGTHDGNVSAWDNLEIDAVSAPIAAPPPAIGSLPRAAAQKPVDQ